MENDPAHAKRLEEKPDQEVAPPSESRTNSPKRACHDDVGPQQESAITAESEQSVWKRRGDAIDNQGKRSWSQTRRHGVRQGRQ